MRSEATCEVQQPSNLEAFGDKHRSKSVCSTVSRKLPVDGFVWLLYTQESAGLTYLCANMGPPLTEPDEAFEAARAEFVSGLSRRTSKLAIAQALSKATTVDDVRSEIAKIEEQQQRSGKLRALGRLKPFVKGLQEYAGVLEVFVQVKPDIIGLIWVGGK